MEACQSCGASLAPEATWCSQCYAVVGPAPVALAAAAPVALAAAAPGVVAAAASSGGPGSPAADPAWSGPSVMSANRQVAATQTTPMVKTRWKKTATTFGPAGRVLCTLALVVPFLVLVAIGILTGGMIIAAPVVWGFVIMPWGLRDTWKAGQLPAG